MQQVPIHPGRPYQHCNQVRRSKPHVHQPRPSMICKSQITSTTLTCVFQSYEIKIKKLGDLSCHYRKKWLRSTIRICFHERRLQYIESEQIAEWARWVLHHFLPHFILLPSVQCQCCIFHTHAQLIQTSGSLKWTHR